MPAPRPEALDFLLSRRSHPARSLRAPAPDPVALAPILTAAARSPDHGLLEPWRFLVLSRAALPRLAGIAVAQAEARGFDPEKVRLSLGNAPLIVGVVGTPKLSEKVPRIEQTLSAGAVCAALVNAALASGWGAVWLTGWIASDRSFLDALGLAADEFLAGLVHVGTPTVAPDERPRPDLAALTTWIDA